MKKRPLNIHGSIGTAVALGVIAMTTCSLIAEEAKPLGERPLIPLPHSYTAKTDAVFKLNLKTTIKQVWKAREMMVFPRLMSISEVAWSAQEQRNWADFSQRLNTSKKRLDIMDINYYKSLEVWEKP